MRDLRSRNGTYVNGNRIGKSNYILRHGDRIRLAGSKVVYVFELVTDSVPADMVEIA